MFKNNLPDPVIPRNPVISLLINGNWLSKELKKGEGDKWRMIADHFEKKDGTPLDNKQLARAAKHMEHNKDEKPRKATIIEKIVKDIKS